jgi:1,4-dihydroxy-2-naphthoyl-CoA hydrolase
MSLWTIPVTLEDLNARAKNTLAEHLGITFVEIGERHLTARMRLETNHMQPMGVMHGGASAALAETVASAAANYCMIGESKMCVGVELNINHLRAVKEGYIDAVAHPLHIGKMIQVWEIKIYDAEGRLTSAARLTLAAR